MRPYYETRSYETDIPLHAYFLEDNYFIAHWHLDIEMVFVCEGTITIGINKESRVLKKGEFAIIRSTDVHYYDSQNMQSTIIVIVFHPKLIGDYLAWPENIKFTPPFIDRQNLNNFNKELQDYFNSIFNCIISESIAKKPYFELYLRGKLKELCAMSLRHLSTSSINNIQKENKISDIEDIQNAILYLENNYMKDISLKDLANNLHQSTFYITRLFKKFTGMGFKEYLTRLRVEKSKSLIRNTNSSILSISLDCGFNSIRTFNRTFKSITGHIPTKLV